MHPIDLTSVEFNVLELLLRHAGNVVTREQIAEVALGPSAQRLRSQRGCSRQPPAQETGLLCRLPTNSFGRFAASDTSSLPKLRKRAGYEPPAVLENLSSLLGRAGLLLGALYLRVHYRITSEHPWWIQPERHEMTILADLAARTLQEQGPSGLSATTRWTFPDQSISLLAGRRQRTRNFRAPDSCQCPARRHGGGK